MMITTYKLNHFHEKLSRKEGQTRPARFKQGICRQKIIGLGSKTGVKPPNNHESAGSWHGNVGVTRETGPHCPRTR